MEKKRISNSGYTRLKESFYGILKEISNIRPQTTFTKEQEEEFLKDAIVIFDYLKSGIDIKSSEILINNGEIPFSYSENILIKFSENLWKDDSKTYTLHIYRNEVGKPVKIYEFLNGEKKDLEENSEIWLESRVMSMKGNILFVKSGSCTKRDSFTKPQLKKIIDYALKNDVILLYDATSNNECKDTENVKSIYEIDNARKVALEFKRFSSVDNDKISCGYLVVPDCLKFPVSLNGYDFFKIKDFLKEEMEKGVVSRKSLKKSFLNYACL